MIAAIHQPHYWPYLGYLDKWDQADILIVLADCEYEQGGYQNRNRIKGPQGAQWLTVPVRHRWPQTIRQVAIDQSQDWRRKHREALRACYGRSAHYAEPALVYDWPWEWLSAACLATMEWLRTRLEIRTPYVLSGRTPADSPTDRLVRLCRQAHADTYLSGPGGRGYLDEATFARAGIELRYQVYEHPTYAQRFGPFLPNLSALDLVFNAGPEAGAILRSGRRPSQAAEGLA